MSYHARQQSDIEGAAPALSLHGISRRFGRHVVLRDATFDVPWSSVIGLLGGNGAGKTTLLRILAGSLSPTRGSISVGSACLNGTADALRTTTALLAGESYLYEGLTAAENLRFAARMANREASGKGIREALDRVGLGAAADRQVRNFSSGMRKRLALARVVAMKPPVLLLDEPYASLDEDATQLVDRIVEDWRDNGRAVVMATHRHDRAARVCDRQLLLVDGVVISDRTGKVTGGAAPFLEIVP